MPIVQNICSSVYNATLGANNKVCIENITGYINETKSYQEFLPYNYSILNAGIYQFKITGDKEPNKPIDWIASMLNIKVTPMAWWDGNWAYCNNITLTGNTANNTIMEINLSSLTFANLSEIRIVTAGCKLGGNEVKHSVLYNGSNWAYVTFLANATYNTYSVYHNNPTNPAYSDAVVDTGCEFLTDTCGAINLSTKPNFTITDGILNISSVGGLGWTITGGRNVLARHYKSGTANTLSYFGMYNVSATVPAFNIDFGARSEGAVMQNYNDRTNIAYKVYGGAGGERLVLSSGANNRWLIGFQKMLAGNVTAWQYNTTGLQGVGNISQTFDDPLIRLNLGHGIAGASSTLFDYVRAYDNESEYVFGASAVQGTIEMGDSEYPQISAPTTSHENNTQYPFSLQINTTITSTNGTARLQFNNTNYTMTNDTATNFYYDIGVLGVGTYPYKICSWGNGSNQNQNCTGMYYHTVIQNTSLVLTASGTTPITFGTAGDVAGSGCPAELSCLLYRDDIEVSNPDTEVLGAGLYTYYYNSTVNTNYTAKQSASFELTVNPTTPTIELYINDTQENKQIDVINDINISGKLIVGEFGNLNLTINYTQVNYSSTQNITSLFNPSALGNYIVWLNYSGSQNYTASSLNYNVSVVHTGVPVVTIVYPISTALYNIETFNLNYTIVEPVPRNCWYSKNGGLTNSSNSTAGENFTGVTATEGENTWTVYCDDIGGNIGQDSISFTVDVTPPEFDNCANFTMTANTSFIELVTASDLSGISTYWFNDTTQFWVGGATGLIKNNTVLTNITTVYLNYSVNDTANNIRSCEFNIDIQGTSSSNVTVGSAVVCRYKKLGYYKLSLPWLKQEGCL
jgi:hypothetical protein